MKINAQTCLLVFMVLMILGVSEATAEDFWVNYSLEAGLSNTDVDNVWPASDGSTWVSTSYVDRRVGDMNRYIDGVFRVYKDERGAIYGGWKSGFVEDAEGKLWCQSIGSHASCNYLQDDVFKRGFEFQYKWNYMLFLAGGIGVDPEGRVWAGSWHGVSWFDVETGEVHNVWQTKWPPWGDETEMSYGVNSLFVTSQGRVLFTKFDYEGSFIYETDHTGQILWSYEVTDSLDLPCEGGKFAESPNGDIWYGCVRGLFLLDMESHDFLPVSPDVRTRIYISPITGELVAPCANSGHRVRVFDGVIWMDYEVPISNECVSVSCAAIDREGNIWVGTRGFEYWGIQGEGLWVLHRDYQLPPQILMGLDVKPKCSKSGEHQAILVDLANGDEHAVDLFVAVQSPSEELLFYPSFAKEMAPFISGVNLPVDAHIEGYELFTTTLPNLPTGTYTWFAACMYAGTTEFASNIASCEWQFE